MLGLLESDTARLVGFALWVMVLARKASSRFRDAAGSRRRQGSCVRGAILLK